MTKTFTQEEQQQITEDNQGKVIRPESLKDYFKYFGPATIVTMVVVGPATISTMLTGGAQLGAGLGWVVVFGALTMWFFCVLSNKTTCMTGDPPLDVLGKFWHPLPLIGAILWFVPQLFIVLIQGSSVAQTGAAIFGISPKIIIWPILILACLVFYIGTFSWLKKITGFLLFCILLLSLIFAIRLLIGPELSIIQVLKGLFIPSWPKHSYTSVFFAGTVGGAGTWGILAYHGYAVKSAGNNKSSMLWVTNMDSFVLGFVLFGLFALSIYFASAGVFYAEGIVPKTAPEAAELFVPFLGEWSFYLFYAGFLGALFTTLAGTNILLVTCIFGALNFYKIGKYDWRPVMENTNYKFGLIISLFIVGGLGAIMGRPAILPALVWSLNLATVFTPPGMALWIYFTNKKEFVGTSINRWYFNLILIIMLFIIILFAIQAIPGLLRHPFIW